MASLAIISLIGIKNNEAIADKFEKLLSRNPIENFKSYEDIETNNYRTVVDQQVTDNGLTITINEVIFDYKNIIITYTLSSNSIDTENIEGIYPKVFIDGKEIKRRGMSGTYSDKGENLKQFVLEPREHLNKVGEFDMKIVIGGKDDFEPDKIIEEGKWEFNFKASNEAINEVTKEININKVINLSNGGSISIDQLIMTPISTTVEFSTKNLSEDDLEKRMSVGCILEDQDGNTIEDIGTSDSYDYLESKGIARARFKNLKKEVKSIKINPIMLFDLYYYEDNTYNKELKEHVIEMYINK